MKKTLLMALCLLIVHSVFAYDYLYNGVYYNLDHVNQTATVTYSSTSYNSYSGTVNIPDYITTDKGMDYDVVAIGDNAFRGSTGLTSVTIATGIEAIGDNAFYGCSGLASVKLPNTVTTLGEYCFYRCSKVTEVTFSSRITAIPNDCFSGCSALKNVTLPKNVTSIGNSAFEGCSALSNVGFSTVLTSIGDMAFQSCYSLSSVTLPSSVRELGGSAFASCRKLSAINLNEGLVKMGDLALSDCGSLTEVSLPSTVETIGANLFFIDTQLASVTMNCQVTELPAYTFYGCSALSIVTLPSALINIRDYAFYGCSKLPSLIIPATLIAVEPNSFSGCNNLKQLYFTEGMTTIPRTYAYAVTQISLPESATAIADNAFYGCSYIPSLLLPASVTYIGENAFANCSNLTDLEYAEGTTTALRTYATKLTKVTIPSTCHTLADKIFDGCTALSSVYISHLEMWNQMFFTQKGNPFPTDHYLYLKGQLLTNLVADFGAPVANFAFANTKGLKSVTLTGSITGVSDNAFSNSTDLLNVVMGNGVKNIGNNAFLGCSSLESVRIGVAVKEIGNNAFNGCSSLKSVRMGGQEQSIGDGAFKGCVYLPSLKLPTTIRTIGTGAFEECKALTQINLPDGMTAINDSTFYNCVLLPEISIPSSVTTIGSEAFYNCATIELLDLPNSVEKIGKNAFSQCVNLNFTTVGTGVKTIESGAFANCSMLKAFYCLATDVPNTNTNSFDGSMPESITLYVPDESVASYKSQSPWNFFATVRGMSDAPTYANNIVLSPEVLILDDDPDHEDYIRATVSPSDATNAKVTWTSSNTSVATVSRTGLVSPIMEGVATITATAADKHGARATALIIVANKFQPVTSLAIDKTTLTLTEGEQLQLVPTTQPATASYDVITWTSSDDNIATVSDAGIITALNQGYADIVATTSDGTKLTAICKLTVDAPATPGLSTVSDANGDSVIDANDIIAVKNHILGRDTSLGNACDVNGDGNITMADVAAITAAMKGEGEIITGPLKFIGLSDSYDIAVDDSKTVTPLIIPYRAGNHIDWSIDDNEIASITTLPNGSCIIKTIAVGPLKLTATANDGSGVQSTTFINITPNYANTETISKELIVGNSLSLVQFIPKDVDASQIIWRSASPNIATIDANGIVTAVAVGNTCIYATNILGKVTIFKLSACASYREHLYVDLGLPSGIKWATCNVGADKPEDYGNYFAWGEVTGYNEGKTDFSWYTYKWGSEKHILKYCTNYQYGTMDDKTVLDPEDDAAHVNWGGSWRMPTKNELEELRTNCTWTWTTQNGVNGCIVTGPNGNSIFLPATSRSIDIGSQGFYWSSSLKNTQNANRLSIGSNNVIGTSSRCIGNSVRAVCP